MENTKPKIAFLFGDFPAMATFYVNQVADLFDRGVEVEVFALRKNENPSSPQRYFEYGMDKKTHFLDVPRNFFTKIAKGLLKAARIFFYSPSVFLKVINWRRYGAYAWSLKLIFWIEPFLGKSFDVVHCHYGTVANKFLMIKDILGINPKIVTTFYGKDISQVTIQKEKDYYSRLKNECGLFIVMSQNMKERVVAQGFDAKKIEILPISIDVLSYPFAKRVLAEEEQINMMTVAHFVEKKGLDDLLRATAIVKEKTKRPFKCVIIGDGPLRSELFGLAEELGLNDVVDFKGYMKMEDIIPLFLKMHFYVQPSKTAKDGDME